MDRTPHTDFLELRGADAQTRLQSVAAAAPAAVRTELLVSRDQADLALLVCRGAADDLAAIATPDGAARWRFAPGTA